MENQEWLRPESQFAVPLGARVRDRISGFEGIAISRVEYLTGCTQYGVAPTSFDGVIKSSEYLDWQRLEYSAKKTGLEVIANSGETLRGNGCMTAPGINKQTPR